MQPADIIKHTPCVIKAQVLIIACIVLSLCSANALAQQVADFSYSPPPFIAAFKNRKQPVVMIDEGHHNFHTATERYAPFARLLSKDGFVIKRGKGSFDRASLEHTDLLVIANALNEVNTTNWSLPTPSAFTDREIATLEQWVKDGGSLFLIADHMPFPGAAEKLAARFGFTFYNGFAFDTTVANKTDLFTVKDHSLMNLEQAGITGVDTAASFTGQAFDIPERALSLMRFDNRYQVFIPSQAWQFDSTTVKISAAGKSQGALMRYGKGRLAVFGEAAMFSAQISGNTKAGMNTIAGRSNYLLLLGIMRWLAQQ